MFFDNLTGHWVHVHLTSVGKNAPEATYNGVGSATGGPVERRPQSGIWVEDRRDSSPDLSVTKRSLPRLRVVTNFGDPT